MIKKIAAMILICLPNMVFAQSSTPNIPTGGPFICACSKLPVFHLGPYDGYNLVVTNLSNGQQIIAGKFMESSLQESYKKCTAVIEQHAACIAGRAQN